jgi:cytochrome c oxidase cbb3-type subunit III
MLRQIFLTATALSLLPMAGCSYLHSDTAASAATPPVRVPIGPMPGATPPPPAPTNPYTNDATALAKGRQLFVQYNCYGCHGGHAGGGMGPSLRDKVWIYGDSDAHVFESIAQGRSEGMPAWGTKLPTDQIWQLVAYVKSLGTSSEPDPPE